jgi:K+ transporter
MKQVIQWAKAHPRLAAWLVLGVGMNAIVIFEARTVGLLAGQWVALIVATTLVAGLCVWIIGWEDDAADEAEVADKPAAAKPEKAATPPAEPKK